MKIAKDRERGQVAGLTTRFCDFSFLNDLVDERLGLPARSPSMSQRERNANLVFSSVNERVRAVTTNEAS